LSPAKEEELKKKFKGKLISARQVAPKVKNRALKIYIDLISKIGATPIKNDRSLRQELKRKDGVCLWWFHNISHKNCEADPTFSFIVTVLIIITVADSINSKEIVLLGTNKEIANILKELYKVKEIQCRKKYVFSYIFIKGLLSRIKCFFTFLFRWIATKRMIKLPDSSLDIVFSGFWDWSIKKDKKTNRLKDRYFGSLPEELISNGMKIGWFLWFDPYGEPGSKGRNLKQILEPIRRFNNLIILQNLIRLSELLKAIINFKPYFIFLRFCKMSSFKKIFVIEGINFYPLLWGVLNYSFLDSTIPHFELVYVASRKAFKKYHPKSSVSFLELFLHSRAFYAGGKQGSPDTIHYAIQHASCSREKTLVRLEPEIEYKGRNDNCPIPKPDYIFSMGELGREIFIESGFPEQRVLLTGSSRYGHITNENIRRDIKSSKIKNILIVTSFDKDLEMEMVEAVFEASKNIPGIRLFLRNHPFARMEAHPDFHNYKHKIQITNGTLEEDLKKTDLIIFSYSTVAEEALVRGIPVWQWLPLLYNYSVFRDLRVVPSFYSVSDLKESLKKFVTNPSPFNPDEKIKALVLKKCFYTTKGSACKRIADYIDKPLL